MINTAAFESLSRYKLLDEAVVYLLSQNGLSPYEWMRPHLIKAMQREAAFMSSNHAGWTRELPSVWEEK